MCQITFEWQIQAYPCSITLSSHFQGDLDEIMGVLREHFELPYNMNTWLRWLDLVFQQSLTPLLNHSSVDQAMGVP